MPTQYRLEVENLDQLKERIEREFGPEARVASAERVSQGGFGRFMARRYIEAIVEVPDDEPAVPPSPAVLRRAARAAAAARFPAAEAKAAAANPGTGLGALLEQADAQEELLATPSGARRSPAAGSASGPPRGEERSGGSGDFMRLLDAERFALNPPTGAGAGGIGGPDAASPLPRASAAEPGGVAPHSVASRDAPARPVPSYRDLVPSPLDGPGDLVVVIGLWGDGVTAGAQFGGDLATRRPAGELAPKFDSAATPHGPILDRRGTIHARAAAVEAGAPLVVSVALNPLQPLTGQLEILGVLSPDQLWIAVDAGRKSEDTAAWVKHISARHRVYALVSLHGNETLSPESVLELGFPVFDITAPVP